jgi:hypothetical protein
MLEKELHISEQEANKLLLKYGSVRNAMNKV